MSVVRDTVRLRPGKGGPRQAKGNLNISDASEDEETNFAYLKMWLRVGLGGCRQKVC